MVISVNQVLQNKEELLGKMVAVRGVLVAPNREEPVWLSPDKESASDIDKSLFLGGPDLFSKIISLVPPLVGGMIHFMHSASVEGILCKSTNPDFLYAIEDISIIEISSAGRQYRIP